MPAKKPSGLITRAQTKATRKRRQEAEDAIAPKSELSLKPPAALRDHKAASRVWNQLIDLYSQTQARIVTSFDEGLLVKYCLAEEELVELEEIRSDIKQQWTRHSKLMAKMKPNSKNWRVYFGALAQANALLQRFQGMDGRIDNKRKMLHAMSQSLYLTPRSRAGVAPPTKPAEKPKGKLAKILDD